MTTSIRFAKHRLDNGIRDLLGKELAERVVATELDSDADEAILAGIGVHVLKRYLPGEILHSLQVFSATACHALILSNLPGQKFPPTPISGFGTEIDLAVTNALHFGLIQLLGVVPFAVDYENSGRLIRNVVPNPAASGITSSWGSDAEFFWHTDNPHLPFGDQGVDPRPYVPRYLTFFTVRNDERVPTDVAAVDDMIGRLDEESRRHLLAPRFRVGAPASNDADPDGGRHLLTDVAVLEVSPDGRYWMRYDRSTTVGATQDADAALAALAAALREGSAQQCAARSR